MDFEYSVHDSQPTDAANVVDRELGKFNNRVAPLVDVVSLTCIARQPLVEVVGGAIGRTWGECCELQQLWVDEQFRGNGIGRHLVTLFEERAKWRGCRTFYLETFSFHSPDFYRSLGYEAGSEIKGFPEGISKYIMVKSL